MNTPMKSCVLQKKFSEFDHPALEESQPDISTYVVSASSGFNARVIRTRELLISLISEGFDPSMLNETGELSLVELLDAVEEYNVKERAVFEDFRKHYSQLVEAGCHVSDWAKSCLQNADNATKDIVNHFDFERERIMGRFYDALPSNVRLGDAPVFGGDSSPSIRDYLSSITS